MSMRNPVEVGLGTYMGQFYAQLVPDTPAMEEYVERGLAKAIAWVPGRMVDDVQAMLEEWRKNDNDKTSASPGGSPGLSSKLPVMLVGMAKDFTPAMPDFGVAIGGGIDVLMPDDPDMRTFKLRLSVNEYRAQVVIMAPEAATAHSLAMQFHVWANGPSGRRFKHWHEFGGVRHDFPALLEQIDLGAVDAKSDQKNLTILIIDLNIRASVPLFPRKDATDTSLVREVDGENNVTGDTWVTK